MLGKIKYIVDLLLIGFIIFLLIPQNGLAQDQTLNPGNVTATPVYPTSVPANVVVIAPATSEPAAQKSVGEWIGEFGPIVIAAVFAGLLGFFGFKRLGDFDSEIKNARIERDHQRDELRNDLRENLERSFGILQERMELLDNRMTAQLKAQADEFNSTINAQQQALKNQEAVVNEKFSEVGSQTVKLLEEINRQRDLFQKETSWLRDSSIGLRKPRNVKDAHDLAIVATTASRRAEAIEVLQLIIDPKVNLQGTTNDYFNSAVQAAALGDFTLAKLIDAEGLKHFPDDIDLLADYADNCSKTGEPKIAEPVWEALSKNPKALTSWRYWIFYSDYLERQGEFERSYELLDEAKKFLPNPTMAYREQAEAMEDRGRYEDAVKLYEEALKYDPSEDVARLKLGQLLFKLGKLDEALVHVDCGIRYVLPRNARYFTAHYHKGQILLALGRAEEAKRALRVAALNDEDAMVLLQTMSVGDGDI